MAPVFCADCGTECALVEGREVDAHDPEIADVRVWACPECPASWAHQDQDGGCVGLPASQSTVNARALLRLQVLVPIVRQAAPHEQVLAASRVRAFLASRLQVPDREGLIHHLNVDQLQQARLAFAGKTYDDVRLWAQDPRSTKRRASASGGMTAHAHIEDLRLRPGPVRVEQLVRRRLGETDAFHVVQQDQDVAVYGFTSLLAGSEAVGQLRIVKGVEPRLIRIGARHRQHPDRHAGRLDRNKRAHHTRIRTAHQSEPITYPAPGAAA